MKKLKGKLVLFVVMLLAVSVLFPTVALSTEEEEEDVVMIGYNSDETQVISYIGKFSETSVKNKDDALKVISEVEKELGLVDADTELEYLTTEDCDSGIRYIFKQIYKGHDVFDSSVSVIALENGIVDSLESTVCATATLDKLDISPEISAEQAEKIAQKDYGKNCDIDSDETKLVIYPEDDTAKLVYSVSVDDESSNGESNDEDSSTVMLIDNNKEVIDKISGDVEEYDTYEQGEDYDVYEDKQGDTQGDEQVDRSEDKTEDKHEDKNESSPLPIIFACVGVVIVIGVVGFIVIKKRKS